MAMLAIKDIALFYLEGNIHAKVTERRNKTKYVLDFSQFNAYDRICS